MDALPKWKYEGAPSSPHPSHSLQGACPPRRADPPVSLSTLIFHFLGRLCGRCVHICPLSPLPALSGDRAAHSHSPGNLLYLSPALLCDRTVALSCFLRSSRTDPWHLCGFFLALPPGLSTPPCPAHLCHPGMAQGPAHSRNCTWPEGGQSELASQQPGCSSVVGLGGPNL